MIEEKRWGHADAYSDRGYRYRGKLIRPTITVEDPPEYEPVEIDWNYVAEVAMSIPGQWLKVDPGIPDYKGPPSSGDAAPLRRNNVRTVLRGDTRYVRYDGPEE